jgi:2-polyprenyl-6-methoxyphenol hydroxylase-like FAD-dependent oxidoreductase
MNVTIQGNGVAARCCARLLKEFGHHVQVQGADRARLPVIMLGGRALSLLRDVFGDPDLLRRAHVIRRRAVAWGNQSEPSTLDHSAVVVSEQILLDALAVRNDFDDQTDVQGDWTIVSARPLREGAVEHAIGSRIANATPVNLTTGADAEACSIESLEHGWLCLIPNTSKSGWLLSVGSTPESLLSASRLVAGEIGDTTGQAREFVSCPRITFPVCGDDWMACGSAAVSFDPICGDGTAYSTREAILASAVIQASARGLDRGDLLAHYSNRINGGFLRHLALCRDLYRSGHNASWWQAQVESVEDGLRRFNERLPLESNVNFQLNGFTLVRS